MKTNKIYTALLFIPLIISCKIGNFMDIGDNNYGALYLYALTSSELLIYNVDKESGLLSDNGSDTGISSVTNICKFVYEKEKNNLFISHGTNPYYISGYNVNSDGSLSLLPGYPVSFNANSVDDYIFTDDRQFLYALCSDGQIYGFYYNSDGSLSPTSQISFSDYTPPAEGFLTFGGYLLKNDTNGWRSYSVAADGTIATYLMNYSLGAGGGEYPAEANGYIFKLLLGAGGSNYGYSYNLNINDIAPTTITNALVVGANGGSTTYNALVKDPLQRFLYFVSVNEDNIYCLRTNTDGSIGTTIDYIPTGVLPGAAAIDPERAFFFTASEDGGGGYQINIHRMNGDLPESTYNIRSGMPGQVLELAAVRYYSR